MTLVTINSGLTLDGQYQQAGGVLQVTPEFFADWYSVSDSKEQPRERPAAEGAFGIDRDWRASLPLALSGWFRGPDWLQMMNALRVGLSTGTSVTIAVTDDDGTTSRVVSVRRFKPRPNPSAQSFTFDAVLVALDPNRYGAEQSFSTGLPTSGSGAPWPAVWSPGYEWGAGGDPGRVSASNAGATTTYPVLEVVGGLGDGVELVEITTGSYLRLERSIPASSTVFFDTRTGGVFMDTPANDVSGLLTRRDWGGFAIPQGGTRTIQFNGLGAVTGTPRLTVRFAPAY